MNLSNMDLKSAESACVALKTFFNIMKEWRVSEENQRIFLGEPDKFTFEKWKKGNVSTLTDDVLERISYVFGVYKNLRILLPKTAQADEWLTKPNEGFNGFSALDLMATGQIVNLRRVRRYLDARL